MSSGSFQAGPRAVIQHRARSGFQLDGLNLAFLAAPPEGGHIREITGTGYEPQRLVFAPTVDGGRTVRNMKPVQFTEVLDGNKLRRWMS